MNNSFIVHTCCALPAYTLSVVYMGTRKVHIHIMLMQMSVRITGYILLWSWDWIVSEWVWLISVSIDVGHNQGASWIRTQTCRLQTRPVNETLHLWVWIGSHVLPRHHATHKYHYLQQKICQICTFSHNNHTIKPDHKACSWIKDVMPYPKWNSVCNFIAQKVPLYKYISSANVNHRIKSSHPR